MEKPGIEKSMKSWWFDYFSKGKLNRENTRGKTRNWEIQKKKKLMIWPLFKRGIWTRKHPWKTRNWDIHEKLMIWLFLKKKFKLGKTPMENQEFMSESMYVHMYVHMYVCMYVCMYECEQSLLASKFPFCSTLLRHTYVYVHTSGQ